MSSLGVTNIGLILIGIILLAIGLVTSYYPVMQLVGHAPALVEWQTVYPYRNVGIVLLVAGIIFVALGFLYPTQKTQTQKTEPPPPQ
jgi:uncharacterized membrane protein